MGFRNKDHVTISLDTVSVLKSISIIFGVIILMAIIRKIAPVLVLLFISMFLALALNPAVSWISRKLKSKSRARATGLAYLMVLSVVIGFFALVTPPLVRQTNDFVKSVPNTLRTAKDDSSPIGHFINQYNLQDQVDQFSSDFANKFKNVGKPVLSTAGAVGVAVVSTITVFVLTFMMLVEGPAWIERILAIQPQSKREQRRKTAHRMYRTVTSYVNGQVIVAIIAGFFALVALTIFTNIFNVSINVIALAAIISMFALLPLIGATIGAVIVVTACLFVSLSLAIAMAIFFIIYQQIENVTIQPYIQSKTNNLTPLIVFVAALVGASIGGLLGAFVAIPTAACIKILVEDHYHAQRLKAESK